MTRRQSARPSGATPGAPAPRPGATPSGHAATGATGSGRAGDGSGVRAVGSADFAEEVLLSPLPVLVDFWAPWCAPCRQMEPVVAGLARELEGRARVVSVDVQAHPGEARSNEVTSVPTYIALVAGREVGRLVGARPKAELKDLLAGHI